jgi:hypothetical protein
LLWRATSAGYLAKAIRLKAKGGNVDPEVDAAGVYARATRRSTSNAGLAAPSTRADPKK